MNVPEDLGSQFSSSMNKLSDLGLPSILMESHPYASLVQEDM